jgi:hypothetical protein
MKNRPTPSRDDILIAELVRANTDALRALSATVSELAALIADRPEARRSRPFDPTTVKTPVSPKLLAQLKPPDIPEGEETIAARPSRMPD